MSTSPLLKTPEAAALASRTLGAGASSSNIRIMIRIQKKNRPHLLDPVDLVSQPCSPHDPRHHIHHRQHRFGRARSQIGVRCHKWLLYRWNVGLHLRASILESPTRTRGIHWRSQAWPSSRMTIHHCHDTHPSRHWTSKTFSTLRRSTTSKITTACLTSLLTYPPPPIRQ